MKIPHCLVLTSLVIATLASPIVATAQCNPNALGVQYMDLRLPFSINTTGYGNSSQPATQLMGGLVRSMRPGCEGWYEALLKIEIPAGCSQANIWVEYEGTPTDWTINVGDSPGNNGFGGDGGQPDSEAELQVLGETLSVYSKGLGPGIVDLLAEAHLALSNGALKIVVRNQYLSWGQPFAALDTSSSQLLFNIPDIVAAEPEAFFLGINRVVSNSPSLNRTGCGARRVVVSFS